MMSRQIFPTETFMTLVGNFVQTSGQVDGVGV